MKFLEKGSFYVGLNYWASHAGIYMWQNWDEEVVRKDMKLLTDSGIKVFRIFPLWSDFQPIKIHYDYNMLIKDIRLGEKPLDDSPEGVAGVDPVMIERFSRLLDIGEEFGITFVVGLITGWMSGRLYAPPALEGRKPLTDPFSIKWQLKFVRYMVNKFKYHKAISAWELGNECNCMTTVEKSEDAYNWVSLITDAIKRCDNTRPVISGMHSLRVSGSWRIKDQAEILDVLTTHPYSIFVPNCDTDYYNEMKTVLHSTAETVFYRGIGKKPAFIEEIGGLGTWLASEKVQSDFFKGCLYSAYAHGLLSAMWWCGFDQNRIERTPYDWSGIERYLGLYHADCTPKPVVEAIKKFNGFVEKAGPISDRIVDAVCIISHTGDSWRTAYGSFLLAKKAGIDIEFTSIDDTLPEAKMYLMPSLIGSLSVYKHQFDRVMKKVEEGATLYVSADNLIFCEPLEKFAGLCVENRAKPIGNETVTINGKVLPLVSQYHTIYTEAGGEVLLRDNTGNPVMSCAKHGKGKVYFVSCPIEDVAASRPHTISGEKEICYEEFYKLIPEMRSAEKKIIGDNPYVGVTEYVEEKGRRAMLVNYRPTPQTVTLKYTGIEFNEVIGEAETSDGFTFKLEANSGAVVIFK